MTRSSLLLALSLAIATRVLAQDAPPIAKYVPSAPDPRHVFVMDSAHILSPAEIGALQDSAKALQAETGADIAWVTLPTLGGRPIEEASVYLGRAWKVGSAGNPGDPLRNRGLVILYVPDKSKTAGSNFRVEVGKGLQGTIIDSRSRAISAAMRDDLRAKRYDAGYAKGWKTAASMVREDFASQHAGGANAGAATAAVAAAGSAAVAGASGITVFQIVFILIIVALVALLIVALIRASGMRFSGSGAVMSGSGWSSWSDSSSSSGSDSSSSSDSGGDFGGGGGFDGGGSSDSI